MEEEVVGGREDSKFTGAKGTYQNYSLTWSFEGGAAIACVCLVVTRGG
jgi:hypothetical protein